MTGEEAARELIRKLERGNRDVDKTAIDSASSILTIRMTDFTAWRLASYLRTVVPTGVKETE